MTEHLQDNIVRAAIQAKLVKKNPSIGTRVVLGRVKLEALFSYVTEVIL